MAPTAGPLEFLDPDALRPFAARASFEALVIDHLAPLTHSDAVLTGAARQVAAGGPGALDGSYAQNVAAALDFVGNEIARAILDPVPAILDAGDSGDRMRQSVLGFLPGVDTPIETRFFEPPPPPPPKRTEPPPPKEPHQD